MKFEVYSKETAPSKSKPALAALEQAVGMIPNLAGAMAESPVLIEGFGTLRGIFQKSTLSPAEREIVSLTNAVANGCSYCVAIHSTFALKSGVDTSTVDALRAEEAPQDEKMAALSTYCQKLIGKRGQVSPGDLAAFLAAGFSKEQALEVVVGIAGSVLANYARHITDAPLDDMLLPQVWVATGPETAPANIAESR